jgi:hypothetical protein
MENLSLDDNSVFWGDYSDLYPTLNAGEIQSLERSILARRLGRLEESQRIFEAELPQPHLLPVLALEKASLLSRLGLERSRYLLLDLALRSQSQWRTKLSAREEELLSITCADARSLTFGATRRALQDARRFREEWTGPVIDEWTDIEVGVTHFPAIKAFRPELRDIIHDL